MLKLYSSLINRYVLTRWVERLIPLRRLTTIAMPHRGPRASLRQAKKPAPIAAAPSPKSPSSDYRRMSAIQILKSGLGNHMWKKQGWLYDLLKREGIVDGSKQSRKEYCWQYYKVNFYILRQCKRQRTIVNSIRGRHITSLERMAASRKKKCNGEAQKPIDNPVPLLRLRHSLCYFQEMEEGRICDEGLRSRFKREKFCDRSKVSIPSV